MPLLSAADLDAAIEAAGGVCVTVGDVTVKGIVSSPDVELAQAGELALVGRALSVAVRSGALPGLDDGVAIVVNGETLKVHRFAREGHGAMTRVLCKKV